MDTNKRMHTTTNTCTTNASASSGHEEAKTQQTPTKAHIRKSFSSVQVLDLVQPLQEMEKSIITIASNVNTTIPKINKQGLPSFQILAQALPVFFNLVSLWSCHNEGKKGTTQDRLTPLDSFPATPLLVATAPPVNASKRFWWLHHPIHFFLPSFFSNLGCTTIPFTLLLGADPVPRLWQAGSILRKRGQKFKLGNVANVLKCHFIVQTPLSTYSVGQLAQIGKHENDFTPICRVNGHSKLIVSYVTAIETLKMPLSDFSIKFNLIVNGLDIMW